MLRKTRIMIAMLLAVLMCVTTIAPLIALAEEPENQDGVVFAKDEENPAEAGITKKLRLPIGTTIPSVKFIFEMTGISIDEDTSRGKDAPIPHEDDLTISFSEADRNIMTGPEEGIFTIRKETLDIFGKVKFDSAGVYVYEITERADNNEAIDESKDEWLYYSKAKYILNVYVANKEGDNNETYIYAIGTKFNIKDDGTPAGDHKVDATPGGGEDFEYSQMIFVNDYVMLNGPDKPDNPDPVNYASLLTSKTVTGIYGDLEAFFKFDITLTTPIILDPKEVPTYFKGYVVEGDKIVTGTKNAPDSETEEDALGRYIKVNPNGTTTFHLKHGQRLVLMDTPVGTRYHVIEHGVQHYHASVIVTTNGVGATEIKAERAGDNLSTGPQHTSEIRNSAAFTNDRNFVAPTGLNMKDLPFFILIALGLGILVAFVGAKVYLGHRKHLSR